jgi:hypothetical protein
MKMKIPQRPSDSSSKYGRSKGKQKGQRGQKEQKELLVALRRSATEKRLREKKLLTGESNSITFIVY